MGPWSYFFSLSSKIAPLLVKKQKGTKCSYCRREYQCLTSPKSVLLEWLRFVPSCCTHLPSLFANSHRTQNLPAPVYNTVGDFQVLWKSLLPMSTSAGGKEQGSTVQIDSEGWKRQILVQFLVSTFEMALHIITPAFRNLFVHSLLSCKHVLCPCC